MSYIYAPARQVQPVGFFPALIGLAVSAIGAKKESDAKKKAAAAAKKAEAEAAAEQARADAAAKAAAAAAPAQPAQQPAPYGAPGYYPQPYGAPYYPQPYYPQPAAYYPQPMYPQASMMAQYGGGYSQGAMQSRSRQNLTAQDSRSIQIAQYRQLIDSRLTEAKTKLDMAERNYRTAYSSGSRENAMAWYQYYNEVQALVSQLENLKVQYAYA